MSDTVIRAENLGKKYILGHQRQERYTALRDVMANGAKSLGRKLLKPVGKKVSDPVVEEFWALKDVSFEIKRGDRVGIIGRNGAGKSTLLKILSRITEPTQGRISIKGRVASLLEVGTGFHPELTGRENIYLNGAILGMSKTEISKKFDEIVAFAEVEKFLDTPVKRYSSGMYVRLAFAVAAHLETEILLVDEVLAVGDIAFQKKCLGKMQDVAGEGKTVLFISHQMAAISNLCSRGIVLAKGNKVLDASIQESIDFYLNNIRDVVALTPLNERLDRKGNGEIKFTFLCLCNSARIPIKTASSGQNLIFNFQLESQIEARGMINIAIGIKNKADQYILHCCTTTVNSDFSIPVGRSSLYCQIPKLPLTPGYYVANIYCEIDKQVTDWIVDAFSFEVEEGDFFCTGKASTSNHGIVFVEHKWTLGNYDG